MLKSFRFSWSITAAALVLSVIMLVAAKWQWSRYKFKTALVESFHANSQTAAIKLPTFVKNVKTLENQDAWLDKKVSVEGRFDYDHEIIVTNREGQIGRGVGPGHYLLTPLLLNSGEGPALLVNRGFIPFEDRTPESWTKYRFPSQQGQIEIQGVLTKSKAPSAVGPSSRGTFAVEQAPGQIQKIWFFEEVPEIAKQIPYPVIENVFLQLLGGAPQGEFPREAVRIQVPPSTHFGYTIEWILLAIATWALAIFLQCYRRRPRRSEFMANAEPLPSSKSVSLVSLPILLLTFLLGVLCQPHQASAEEKPEVVEQEVGIIQHLGAQVNLGLRFVDENGVAGTLASFAKAEKPMIVLPVYFGCPRLCTLTFEGLVKLLKQLKLKLGEDFSVLVYSIDPEDKPQAAKKKAETLLTQLKLQTSPPHFRFLTGQQPEIHELSQQLGFIYKQDGMDFAHSPGIMLLTPEGKISRYFLGVDYPEPELRYSLVEASGGKIGGLAEQIFLYCFRFDETKGKYTPAAWRLMRVGSSLVALLLAGFLISLWRAEKKPKPL